MTMTQMVGIGILMIMGIIHMIIDAIQADRSYKNEIRREERRESRRAKKKVMEFFESYTIR